MWNPDGKRLLFLGAGGKDRFIVGRVRPKQAPVARRITRTDFRDDDSGLLGRRTHLWSVAARPGARPRRLTQGDFDVEQPTWAPDGSWIAFTADMGDDWNVMPRTALYRVSSGGGPPSLLAELPGDAWKAAISPDGRTVAFLGTDVADPPEYALTRAWHVPVEGGTPRCLTPELDRSVGNGAWADLVMADDDPGPAWLDSESLIVIVGDRGRNVPYRLGLDGRVAPLVEPGRIVGCGVATAAGRVALSAGVDRHAAELYALEDGRRGSSRMRRLTTNGSGWQDRFPLPAWEEAWFDGPGGPIQTWIVSPARAGAKPLPTIVIIHGGPTGCHGAWRDHGHHHARGPRLPARAGQHPRLGHARGGLDQGPERSLGPGRRRRHPRRPGWRHRPRTGRSTSARRDGPLLRWLPDAVAGRPYDRFGAAVAENGVANQVSAWGNSYFGVHYNRRHNIGDPLTERGMRQLWRTSPLSAAAEIHTPLLMLQAEEDRNCPAADNEQLFTALKVLGREVEYVLYPEEHHELKNYGRPDRRIDRMDRVLAWFDRYLGGEPSGGR